MSVARLILSFDFEIGWGDITNPMWRVREKRGVYKRLRRVLPELLAAMDRVGLPATFATVGGLFDDPASRDFTYLPDQWRTIVESVLAEAEPESFNGADLFAMVRAARAGHAIGCHSYAHVPYTYEGMTRDVVRADLRRHRAALAKLGLGESRFVFPENREAHHEVLGEEGFSVFRVAADNVFANRWLYLASTLVLPAPPSREEPHAPGLQRQYGSMLFNDAGKAHRLALLRWRAYLALNAAIARGTALHIWAHPFNFAESDGLLRAFVRFVENAARARDRGKLEFALM